MLISNNLQHFVVTKATNETSAEVRHEAQRWNGWKIPQAIQVAGEPDRGYISPAMLLVGEGEPPRERYW